MKAVKGKGHSRNRCVIRSALRHDSGFEFRTVDAPLVVWGDRLSRHRVHDLHHAHMPARTGYLKTRLPDSYGTASVRVKG